MIAGIIGLLSGFISAMGIGGGTVLIPALVVLLDVSQRQAQSTNLLAFLPTAAVALFIHIKNKRVVFYPWLVAGGVLGAVGGALLGTVFSEDLLRRLFGGFLLILGIHEFWKAKPKKKQAE